MHDGPDGQATGTVVAHSSVAEERTVGASQPVIVHGGDDRNPRIPASVEYSIAQQRKRVVDVDHLGAVLAQHCFQVTVGFAAPDGPGRKRRLLRHRPLADLVAAAAEPHDLVSLGGERLALLIDDTVLSAGSTRAVAVVDKQDPHPGGVTSIFPYPSTREPARRGNTSDGGKRRFRRQSPLPSQVSRDPRQIQKARRVRIGEPAVADPTPITSVAGTFCPNAGEYQPSTGSLAPRINDQPSDDGRVIVAVASPPFPSCHRSVRTQSSKSASTAGPK